MEQNSPFNKWCWNKQTCICKKEKQKLESRPRTYILYKNLLKLDHISETKPQYQKTRKKKNAENLNDLGYRDDFLDIEQKARSMKETIDKLNFIKIKNLCSVNDSGNGMRRQATDKRNYLQKTHLIEKYYPKHTKNS